MTGNGIIFGAGMLEPASGAWALRLTGHAAGPTPDGTEATEDIMADFRPYQVPNAATRADAAIDQGLRAYMIKVYNLMAMGLVITGVAAWGTWHLAVVDNQLTQFGQLIYTSPLKWVLFLAPVGWASCSASASRR